MTEEMCVREFGQRHQVEIDSLQEEDGIPMSAYSPLKPSCQPLPTPVPGGWTVQWQSSDGRIGRIEHYANVARAYAVLQYCAAQGFSLAVDEETQTITTQTSHSRRRSPRERFLSNDWFGY